MEAASTKLFCLRKERRGGGPFCRADGRALEGGVGVVQRPSEEGRQGRMRSLRGGEWANSVNWFWVLGFARIFLRVCECVCVSRSASLPTYLATYPMIELAQLFPPFLSFLPKVSWIRERDTTLISVGRYTYTTDQGRHSLGRLPSFTTHDAML